MPGQGQRGGQPGAQRKRLHAFPFPTVAAAQRHTTRGLLTTLRTLPHTHTAARSQQSDEQACFIQFGHEDRDFPGGDPEGRMGRYYLCQSSGGGESSSFHRANGEDCRDSLEETISVVLHLCFCFFKEEILRVTVSCGWIQKPWSRGSSHSFPSAHHLTFTDCLRSECVHLSVCVCDLRWMYANRRGLNILICFP